MFGEGYARLEWPQRVASAIGRHAGAAAGEALLDRL
jgi:hypothetical protein